MFSNNIDDRLSAWAKSRQAFSKSKTPFVDIMEFWNQAGFTPYNKNIDPYNSKSWPTPWEIISENVYDDFTKALMISYTIKLLPRFEKSKVEIRILTNDAKRQIYNIVVIDDEHVLNYIDEPTTVDQIDTDLLIDTIVEVSKPR